MKIIMQVGFLWLIFWLIVIKYPTLIYFPIYSPIVSWFDFDDKKTQVENWKDAEIRSLPVQISDQAGRYVGFLDSSTEPGFRTTGHESDHKSENLERAPDEFWKCLRFLEDNHMGHWHNPNGVDLSFPVIVILRGRGGSTIPMQLVRSLNKEYMGGSLNKKDPVINQDDADTNQDDADTKQDDAENRKDYILVVIWEKIHNTMAKIRNTVAKILEKILDNWSRKWKELYQAPLLNDWLYKEEGKDELARWSANHMTIIQGSFDYDVVGVGAASRVLFGKPASKLTTAEEYLLAAAR